MTGIALRRLYTPVATGQSFAGLDCASDPRVLQTNSMSGQWPTKNLAKLDGVGSALLLFQ